MIILIFVILLVSLLISLPVAFSIGTTTIIASLFTNIDLTRLPQSMFGALDSFTLLALPLFILAGKIMELGGISQKLITFASIFFGRMRGGLAMVAIVACMFFAAISGSAIATTVSIGSIMIPAMAKVGYDRRFSASLIAAGGLTGGIIPPSLPLLLFGVIGGVSVGKLFIAGIVPGIIIGLSIMLVAYVVSIKKGYGLIKDDDDNKKITKDLWSALKDSILALIMPVIVLGGIYGGFFTPTESAVVAVVYGLIIGAFVYKQITFTILKEILHSTVLLTSAIGIIISVASFFSLWLTLERVPHTIVGLFSDANFSPIVTILIINLFLLILGTFMDAPSATIITVPMLLPLVTAVGIDPVHFGIIMVVNLSIGELTPPLGMSLFVASKVGNIKFESLLRPIVPFLLIIIIDLLIITFIPEISLGLTSSVTQ